MSSTIHVPAITPGRVVSVTSGTALKTGKNIHDTECHRHRTVACNRHHELPSQASELLRRPCSCLGCLHDPVGDGNTLHRIMILKSTIVTGFKLFPVAVNYRRLASRSEHREHVVIDGAVNSRLNDAISIARA